MATRLTENQVSQSEKTREDLEEALRQCREQLAKTEAMLLKSKQDNLPTE